MMEPAESDAGFESVNLEEDPPSITKETAHLIHCPPPLHSLPTIGFGVEENSTSALDGTDRSRPLAFIKTIVGECFCELLAPGAAAERGMPVTPAVEQFVQIHGVEFIGLGALSDELSSKERVYDTLEQLKSRSERLISIGYLSEDENGKKTTTIPLDIWSHSYPDDRAMSRPIRRTINSIKVCTVFHFSISCYLSL
jgi:hypothetical protein